VSHVKRAVLMLVERPVAERPRGAQETCIHVAALDQRLKGYPSAKLRARVT